MALQTLPDVEGLVGGWLTAHPDIAALNARVASRTPDSMTRPWVRVTLLAPDDRAGGLLHLMDWTLQLDCYAGEVAMSAYVGRQEAWRLSASVVAVLRAQEGAVSGGVVVTRVAVPGWARLPDTAYEPARERYVLTVDLMLHPV